MSKLTLSTLRTAATPLYASADVPPTRMVVLPWGVNNSRRGRFVVNDRTVQVFAANQLKNRIDGKVALDFEHNTLEGTAAYNSSSEPRPIAAWALCQVIKGEGLVYDQIEWTPDGLSAWERKLYQDLSPAPVRGADGETVIALHSTALCRHGELEGLTIDHAAAPKGLAAYFDSLSADSHHTHTHPTAHALTPLMKQKLIALLAALGVTLDPNADETTTATALDTALANYTKEEKKEGASTANKEKAKTESAPEGMSAEVSAMRAEIEQMRKETVIAEATRAGKVIPLSAAAIKVTPLSAIIELADNATPGAVPLKKKTVDGKEVPLEIGAKPDALSAETLAMAASMGLSEADLKKYAAEG